MPRRIEGSTGEAGIVLPGGWVLDAGDIVVVPDDEWAEIKDSEALFPRLEDLGATIDPPTPVPTYRDLQRAVAGGSTGLEAQIDAVNASLLAHLGDTTDVHGIVDTAKLAWLQQVSLTGADVGEVLTKTGASAYGFSPAAGGGADTWEQTYNFASASTDWVINHGQGTKSIHVEVENTSGQPMEAKVVYVDLNTIRVEHYFAEAGNARLWSTT
jgi:hypothetical protein